MTRALVVVDMQKYFMDYAERVLRECKRLIRQSIVSGDQIFILQYIGCGDTYHTILKMIEFYPKATVIKKDSRDGSQFVAAMFSQAPEVLV